MKKRVAYKKILRRANYGLILVLGRYVDRIKYKLLNKPKEF